MSLSENEKGPFQGLLFPALRGIQGGFGARILSDFSRLTIWYYKYYIGAEGGIPLKSSPVLAFRHDSRQPACHFRPSGANWYHTPAPVSLIPYQPGA
jgi:hypothetical protein